MDRRWLLAIGLAALAAFARTYGSSGQETPRGAAPGPVARVTIIDLVVDPSPIEKGAAGRFSVHVRSEYSTTVQVIVSVRGSAIGAAPMGTSRTIARGDSVVRIPGQRAVTVTGPQPDQRCLVVDGRVNEAPRQAAAVTAQISPKTFCLEEVFVLKAK